MSCVKAMLSVLMDGITDANMWLDYSEEAADADRAEYAAWFKSHAKKRIDTLESIEEYVFDEIDIDAKIKAGDEISKALKDHIENEVSKLHKRLDAA